MKRFTRMIRAGLCGLLLAGALLAVSFPAMADKIHLKDGRVLEGTLVRETSTFVQFKIKVGGIESTQTFQKDEVVKVEKDNPGATDPKPEDKKPDTVASGDAKKDSAEAKKAEEEKRLNSGTTRVAILHFGPPSEWGKSIGDTVGVEITAATFRKAIPLLEKDKVDVVVIQINSGGGALSEMDPFQQLFQYEYKPRFRTVGWVESAISCAAMSPYSIEEFYFLPNGNLGACTAWHGNLQNMEGPGLTLLLAQMEQVSQWGRRSPFIMKAMQIQVPLSATIDERTGEVHWFQDTTGEIQVNPANQILTLTAQQAVRLKFAKGIAKDKEELAKVMGINEVVWAGEEASRFVDESLKLADKGQKRWQTVYQQYGIQVEFASQEQDRQKRGSFVGKARQYLNELHKMYNDNPNFGMVTGMPPNFFDEEEQRLRDLMR